MLNLHVILCLCEMILDPAQESSHTSTKSWGKEGERERVLQPSSNQIQVIHKNMMCDDPFGPRTDLGHTKWA